MEKILLTVVDHVEEKATKKSKFLKNKNLEGLTELSVQKQKFPVYMILIPQHVGEIGFMMVDPESSQRFTVKSPKDGWRETSINGSQLINLKKIVKQMFENGSELENLGYCNVLRRYDEGYVIYASARVHNYTEEREELKHIYMPQIPGFPRSQVLNRFNAWEKISRKIPTDRMRGSRFKALCAFRKYNKREEEKILELHENTQIVLFEE